MLVRPSLPKYKRQNTSVLEMEIPKRDVPPAVMAQAGIPDHKNLRQEDYHEFKASLHCIVKSCLKIPGRRVGKMAQLVKTLCLKS